MKHTQATLQIGDILHSSLSRYTIIKVEGDRVYYQWKGVDGEDDDDTSVSAWLSYANNIRSYKYESKYNQKFEAHKKRMLSV